MSAARPPFVWTPRQPIAKAWLVALRDQPKREDGRNRWFLFRTEFDLADVPHELALDVTVDGRYAIFVNGAPAGRGPVRSSPLAKRYDTHEVAAHLRPGRNAVGVLVHTYGVDTAFHEETRGLWRPVFGDGGLWVRGAVAGTHGPWRCRQSDAWTQDVPQANHSLGFIEDFDARRLPEGWSEPGHDDTDWDEARIMEVGGGGPEAMYQGMWVRPFPILVPSRIPALVERPARAERLRWVKGQEPGPALAMHLRLYDETLVPLPAGAVEGLETVLAAGEAAATVRTADGVDTAFTLDFGRIFSGHPVFEIEAKGGETIEIGCAERLPGEWFGTVDPAARIQRRPILGTDAHLLRYVARPGRQRFQRFEWCAIRYMHVVVRNAPAGVVFRALGAAETHYPVAERGRFSCSDEQLTKLWSAGAYTLRQCMHDAWEDCPSREQRQWLGDVTVENLAAWAAFGDSAAPLTAKYLLQAAESQRSDGLTQMFAPGDHGHDARLIPDWTLQWILCAADHWSLTGDLPTIETIWPAVEKALGWFERVAGPHGLVVDMPYWHFMDWAGLGREHQALALNAQLAGALRAAADLAEALENGRAARRYRERAEAITARLELEHWDEERGVFVDMVDPEAGRRLLRVSQHGVAALALWGAPDAGALARAFDWITDPERVTQTPAPPVVPLGTKLDEERGAVMANTFYSHFLSEALARHGRAATALAGIKRRFGPMIEAGSTTLWEATTPWASLCHGFSASPTYFLSRHVLGVAPATPGFERIAFRPDLLDLDHAEGVVPVGADDLEVALRRTEGGFTAVVRGRIAAIDPAAPPGFEMQETKATGNELEIRYARTLATS